MRLSRTHLQQCCWSGVDPWEMSLILAGSKLLTGDNWWATHKDFRAVRGATFNRQGENLDCVEIVKAVMNYSFYSPYLFLLCGFEFSLLVNSQKLCGNHREGLTHYNARNCLCRRENSMWTIADWYGSRKAVRLYFLPNLLNSSDSYLHRTLSLLTLM